MPKTKTKSRKRKSQVAKVYNWLTNGNSINPRTAISRFNIYRLAAVIFVLRNEYGMTIDTDTRRGFATYRLAS